MAPRDHSAGGAAAPIGEEMIARTVRDGLARDDSPDVIARAVVALLKDAGVTRASEHPTRIAILQHSRSEGSGSPKEVAAHIGVELSSVTHHFRRLEERQLIELCGVRPSRGAIEHFYRLTGSDSQPPPSATPLPQRQHHN